MACMSENITKLSAVFLYQRIRDMRAPCGVNKVTFQAGFLFKVFQTSLMNIYWELRLAPTKEDRQSKSIKEEF